MSEVTAALAQARAAAAVMLIDTCTITVDADHDADATVDPVTLVLTDPADAAPFWSGPCLLEAITILGDVPTAPDTFESGPRYRASLPYDAPVPPSGAILTMTASQDPALVGVPLRVDSGHYASIGLFRVLTVEARPLLITAAP